MKALKIKENGDWDLSTLIYDEFAVIQRLKEVLKLPLKSAFWDEEAGINFQAFFGESIDKEIRIKFLISQMELQAKTVPYVESILISIKSQNENVLTLNIEASININGNKTTTSFQQII